MGEIQNYTSLFELGFGLDIALSLFRIPVDEKKRRLTLIVERQLRLFEHQNTEFAQQRYEAFGEISVELDIAINHLEDKVKDFPIGMLLGSFVNAIFLIIAASDPEYVVNEFCHWFFCFVAFGWFSIAAGLIFFLVGHWLGPVDAKISEELRRKGT